MDRRSLLRGLFAAPAIVAASSLMPVNARLLRPFLVGDGITDDTDALQWMIDRSRNEFVMPKGRFVVRSLVLPRDRNFTVDGSWPHATLVGIGGPNDYVLESRKPSGAADYELHVNHVTIEVRSAPAAGDRLQIRINDPDWHAGGVVRIVG